MSRAPAAPKNLRIGLKWRDGRPRWEPSPASRKVGIKGLDLKTAAGAWMDRGAAITAADARQLWASLVREAHGDDASAEQARADLRLALDALPAPAEAADRHARAMIQDLIDMARALIDGRDAAASVRLAGGPRTVDALIDLYFADPTVKISVATRRTYAIQAKKIRAKFAGQRVDGLTTGALRAWYHELTQAHSLATSNQVIAALSAMLQIAIYEGWTQQTPAVRLGLETPAGRRVFWTVEEENSYIPWLDDNGYADLADALVLMLWTGARPIDACGADLDDLAGDTWLYVPVKTQKRKREALPGLIPLVQARVARRRKQTVATLGEERNAFLLDIREGRMRRHTPKSLATLHREARAIAVAQGAVPASIMEKQIRDTRDTCITKLVESVDSLLRISAWTAHSMTDIETIIRDHYLVLRKEGARETAAKLIGWAERNGVELSR